MIAAATLVSALLVAAPAAAQDQDGWTLTEASGALIASASYESGQSFVVRCRNRRLDALPSSRLRLGPGVEPGRLVISRLLYRLE